MSLFSKYIKNNINFFSIDMFINIIIEKNYEEDIKIKSFINIFEIIDIYIYEIK